ncbi:MAG: V-type ATPase subunit [bacterium]|nr:V-type ATPase subunit [bacterium]
MTCEIEYLNAHIRGGAGRLLPEESVAALFGATTRASWTAALRDTPYSIHLGPVAGDQDSRLFFRAVDQSIAHRTHRLGHLVNGRPGLALSVCLSEWDLSNLLGIVSGICNSAQPAQIIPATVAGGLLGPDQMETLSHCRTLPQAADFLRLWRFPKQALVHEVFFGFQDMSLPQIRLELSRRWHGQLLKDARQAGFRALIRLMSERIDQINIMTALMWRVLPSDRDPVEFFLEGGSAVDLRTFRKALAAPDILEAISALTAGRLRSVLQAAAVIGPDGEERISALHQALENELTHRYSRPLVRDPLGIELMISFLLRLRREGIRIKLSLTRLIYDIPRDIFLEMTGYV